MLEQFLYGVFFCFFVHVKSAGSLHRFGHPTMSRGQRTINSSALISVSMVSVSTTVRTRRSDVTTVRLYNLFFSAAVLGKALNYEWIEV